MTVPTYDSAASRQEGKPLISIVIPSFNTGGKIEHCLHSICSQTFGSFEILVMDGESSDDTCMLVKRYQEKYPNIHLSSTHDKGIYDAMNKGIAASCGQWLLFLGADDELHDETVLGNVSSFLLGQTADIVYGDVLLTGDTLFGKSGDRYAGAFSREMIIRQNICHQSVFYRKTVFEKLGPYKLEYPINADWDINLQGLAMLETSHVPMIISKFSPGGQSSRRIDRFYEQDRIINAAHYFRIGYLNRSFRGQGKAFYRISGDRLKKGNYSAAFFFALVAFYQSPAEVLRYTLDKLLLRK